MTWQRILQSGGWLLGGGAVLLVVLYAVTGQSTIPEPSVAGPTAYPSIVLYPTLVPTPAPDTEPRVLDLASGHVQPVPVPSSSAVQAVLSDGTLLVNDGVPGPTSVIIRPDGTVISKLPIPANGQCDLSTDNRYVAWIDGDSFRVYDAETARVSAVPPDGARFAGSLSDGGVLMGDASGICPAPPPSSAGTGEETVIVDRNGSVTDRLPLSRWNVALSPDERRIAWVAGQGLHVYDRSTQTERLYPEVVFVTGEIAWSPDSAEIGYVRFTGDNALHVWVVDVASGEQHAVYSAGPDVRIRRLEFTANHELRFQIVQMGSVAVQYDLPGARYAVADDGSGGRFLDDPSASPWSACGPSCGLPPDGYEDADGLARWCELTHDGNCISHLVLVDRSDGVMRELAASVFVTWSFSPDRQRLAILLSAGTDQVLRIVRLDDLTSRDVPLGFSYANNVAWFPDGRSLLLWTAGGN